MPTRLVVTALVLVAGCRSGLEPPSSRSGPDPTSQQHQASWPLLQHDAGHSGRTDVVGPARPQLAWSFDAGDGPLALPLIGADGTLYFGAGGKLHALAPDGHERWSYGPIDIIENLAIGADGTIYASASVHQLRAIGADGQPRWSFTAGDDLGGVTVGPDGTIYAASLDAHVYALHPDGTLRWSFAMDDGGFWTPAIGPDGTVYVGTWRNYSTPAQVPGWLYAFDPDGTEKWVYQKTGTFYTPVVGHDGTIYVRTGSATLDAIGPDGVARWQAPVDIYTSSAPAIAADGTIYVGTGQNELTALDPTSGARKWTVSRFDLCDRCSPTIGGDGTIYISGFENHVYAITPDGDERWSFTTDESNVAVDDAIAIGADGTLYQGGQGSTLDAIGAAPRGD